MENNYFIYDSIDFSDRAIKDLSAKLEKLGFTYHKYTELGGAPGIEQVVVWLHNHQFISSVTAGILANYLWEILKNLNSWFKSNRSSKNIIPIVEVFLHFKDLENEKIRADLSFRFDETINLKELEQSIKQQTIFFRSVSHQKNQQCTKCGQTIHPHQVYYLKANKIKYREPVCIFCKKRIIKN